MQIPFLIQLVLLLYASQFIVAPLVIYFTHKRSANPQFTPFDLVNPPLQLPPSYMQTLPLLESLGFDAVAHLFSGALASKVRVALTLYVNRIEREIAMVVHMLGEVPPLTRVLSTYTEFCTEFDDGHEMSTSNSKQATCFAAVPEKQSFLLPNLTNLQQVYEVHRAVTGRRLGTNKRVAVAGQEVNELDGMKRDLAREAASGRIALDASGEWYRPTMRGAIHSTLMLTGPVGILRRMLQRRRGVRLAAEVFRNRSL